MAGVFVGGFCFPHGAIILDPFTRDFTNVPAATSNSQAECIRLHNATRALARLLLLQKPDVIILSTPHGLKLDDSFLFLKNTKASGSAEWDDEWKEYKATVDIDVTSSVSLATKLKTMGNPVETLCVGVDISFGVASRLKALGKNLDYDVLPLRWAEVVPIWFIHEVAKELNLPLPPVVFLGQKWYKENQSAAGFQESLKLGRDIASVICDQVTFEGKRVGVVISSDLAHTYSDSPSSPFGFHPSAAPFDSLMETWAKMDIQESSNCISGTAILTEAAKIVESARSCGFSGLVMLQGMLEYLTANGDGKGFKATVLENLVPTYYGMMVNSFLPVE